MNVTQYLNAIEATNKELRERLILINEWYVAAMELHNQDFFGNEKSSRRTKTKAAAKPTPKAERSADDWEPILPD